MMKKVLIICIANASIFAAGMQRPVLTPALIDRIIANSTHTPPQMVLNELLLDKADPTFGGPYDLAILIEHGADVNYKNNNGWTPIARILSSIATMRDQNRSSLMTSLLLQHGAKMFTKQSSSRSVFMHCTYWQNEKVWEALFTESIFVPSIKTLARSKKNVVTILCCLKSKGIHKNLFPMILCNIPTHNLGNVMVERKLQGKSIPDDFMLAAENALYDSTIKQFCRIYQDLTNYEPSGQYFNQICAAMRENIYWRLQSHTLYSNGEYTNPDETCTII